VNREGNRHGPQRLPEDKGSLPSLKLKLPPRGNTYFSVVFRYAEDALAFVRLGRLGALLIRGGAVSLVLANQSAAIISACSSSSVVSDALTFFPACDIFSVAIRYHM